MSNKKWPINLSISDSKPMLSEQNRIDFTPKHRAF